MKQTHLIITLLLSLSLFSQAQEKKDYKELIATLDSIHYLDQTYREQSVELEKEYAWDSPEIQKLAQMELIQDSLNLIEVEKIIAEHGWLGPDLIGEKGNKTIFLVIQHADITTQEKYLPILKDAVQNGNTKGAYLALMEDRILIRHGEKQIYGSQIAMNYETNQFQLSPMIHPEDVDNRRNKIGLNPIADYLKIWDLTWDLEVFKKRMEQYDLEDAKK